MGYPDEIDFEHEDENLNNPFYVDKEAFYYHLSVEKYICDNYHGLTDILDLIKQEINDKNKWKMLSQMLKTFFLNHYKMQLFNHWILMKGKEIYSRDSGMSSISY